MKQLENVRNIERVNQNLNFSQQANKNLKNDYDLLQEKFDKHMKATNNLNIDLKEEIEKITNELSKLKLFKDDADEHLK